MAKKIKIDFAKVKNVSDAIFDYSERFGTSTENLPIEKQYWTEYFKKRPAEKQDLVDIYSDLEYDNIENQDFEPAHNCRVIIDFVNTL